MREYLIVSQLGAVRDTRGRIQYYDTEKGAQEVADILTDSSTRGVVYTVQHRLDGEGCPPKPTIREARDDRKVLHFTDRTVKLEYTEAGK